MELLGGWQHARCHIGVAGMTLFKCLQKSNLCWKCQLLKSTMFTNSILLNIFSLLTSISLNHDRDEIETSKFQIALFYSVIQTIEMKCHVDRGQFKHVYLHTNSSFLGLGKISPYTSTNFIIHINFPERKCSIFYATNKKTRGLWEGRRRKGYLLFKIYTIMRETYVLQVVFK